jgi:glycosyltransferase involved in cell wall biosynthesis
LQLTVVTAPVPALLAELARWNREAAPAMTVQFTAWSLAETQRQLAGCDLVIIPSLDNERKNVKSPNRLTETIWAGRLAVAYPIPSYMEFAAFAHIATDLEAALSEVLATPGSHAERIAAGQQYIAGHYSHEAIGRRWEAIFQGAG